MYILRVQVHLTSTSTFNKQVQLNETSTIIWNEYKYIKQGKVHETSKVILNKYKYIKWI